MSWQIMSCFAPESKIETFLHFAPKGGRMLRPESHGSPTKLWWFYVLSELGH